MPLSKTSCPVGQITGICSTSQKFRARARKLVAGFFNRAALFAIARSKAKKENPIVVERSRKNLTRRANHRHIFIIARILEPAPEMAAGFFNRAVSFRHCEEQSEEAIQSSSNDPGKV
jgi:hypothetical protein